MNSSKELNVEQEIWNYHDIVAFATMMGWHDLLANIAAIDKKTKQAFQDNLKHGEMQVTLYRNVDEDDAIDCPYYFTNDCRR
jgi:hypothetical protein